VGGVALPSTYNCPSVLGLHAACRSAGRYSISHNTGVKSYTPYSVFLRLYLSFTYYTRHAHKRARRECLHGWPTKRLFKKLFTFMHSVRDTSGNSHTHIMRSRHSQQLQWCSEQRAKKSPTR